MYYIIVILLKSQVARRNACRDMVLLLTLIGAISDTFCDFM